jgi:hypothetical protein
MKISMLYTGKVIQAIEECLPECHAKQTRFKILKIKAALQDSIKIAQPLIEGSEDDLSWLATANSLDFEALKRSEVIAGFQKLSVESARWLLLLTKD